MQTTDFLQELFGDQITTEQRLLIFTMDRETDQKESHWFSDTSRVEELLVRNAQKDCYFGIGLSPQNFGPKKRCPASEVASIPGLWADVDYAHDVHQKSSLPPTKADAVSLITSSLPPHLQPTITVHTGHGYHFYWLFKEPFIIETDKDRKEIADLSQRWQYTLKYHAARRGWEVDSTFDLARVFRLPGTLNNKEDKTVPVIVENSNENRYNPDDFEEALVEIDEIKDNEISELLSKEKNPLGLIVSANANPPFGKFEALRKFSVKFASLYSMDRKEKTKDSSLSSYELGMANICVDYDWLPQEIADLIISFRRNNAQTEAKAAKALRIDYLNRTILTALQVKDKEEADEALEDATMQLSRHRDDPEAIKAPNANSVKANLQKVLGIKIHRLWKYLGDDPKYEIELESKKKIMVGSIINLIQQGNLRNILAAHCNVLLPRFKQEVWDRYATLLLQSCDDVRTGEETAAHELLASNVKQYVDTTHLAADWHTAFVDYSPYKKDGRIYIFGNSLRTWLKICAEPMTAKEMGVLFASLGIASCPQTFVMEDDGGKKHRSTRSVYDVTKIVARIPVSSTPTANTNVVNFPSVSGPQTEHPELIKEDNVNEQVLGPFAKDQK